ncbi:DUF4232 domain-containing protein [Streptomyces sp. NPDC005808]|uniref:DUF4232 domain-containing protein n=1 Tax=Streptomyces sp. NPDC005808 TaxID=3364734 RepID=UPI003686FAB3
MRAIPIAVTALVAALTLTACGDGGDGDSGGDGGTKATASAADASTSCQVGQVGMAVESASAAPAAGDTGIVPVTITNTGAQCTLEGFPGIVLGAGAASATVAGDDAAQPEKLTLAKGDTATFTLTYVRGEAADAASLDAKTVKVSLPGDAATQDFPWSYGPVAGKAGKTGADDPDASVSPFQHAGD